MVSLETKGRKIDFFGDQIKDFSDMTQKKEKVNLRDPGKFKIAFFEISLGKFNKKSCYQAY